MSSKKNKSVEEALIEQASVAVETVDPASAVSGHKLPSGFHNPRIGEMGHYCMDPGGVYHRDWVQLMIHRHDDSAPSRQFFCNGSKDWNIITGDWVDVPPGLISCLLRTEVEVIELDITKANSILDDSVKKVVRRTPRFSYNMIPSA